MNKIQELNFDEIEQVDGGLLPVAIAGGVVLAYVLYKYYNP